MCWSPSSRLTRLAACLQNGEKVVKDFVALRAFEECLPIVDQAVVLASFNIGHIGVSEISQIVELLPATMLKFSEETLNGVTGNGIDLCTDGKSA